MIFYKNMDDSNVYLIYFPVFKATHTVSLDTRNSLSYAWNTLDENGSLRDLHICTNLLRARTQLFSLSSITLILESQELSHTVNDITALCH